MIRRMSLLNTYYLGKRSAPEDADITGIPSKAKKTDLVTMLVEEDGKKKQDGTGGGSKVNPTESSGSLSKASETSSKEEGWIIETKFISSRCCDEPDIKIVGIFTSKEKAIENAKKAFANMDYFEDADGWDNEGLEDYSKKIDKKFDKGCKGGVLFQMDISDEGDTISVSIYKCFIDKTIKSIDKAMDYDDADSEEDDIINSDDESEYE